MKSQKTRKSLTIPFFLLTLVLAIILYSNLKRQLEFRKQPTAPSKVAWKAIVNGQKLRNELGLKFVRSSGILFKRTHEYLYSRTHTAEEISTRVSGWLNAKGVETGRIVIGKSTGDVKIELVSGDVLFAELILTPDMSTYAGTICLIVDDFGYNLNSVVKDFLRLEIPVTFSVLPGHAYSKKVATLADAAGFEVMIHMPMETKDNRAGEGEYVLGRDLSAREIRARLRKALTEIPQAKGINNHQGSAATESRRVMRIVAEVLRSENRYFVDSKTTAKSVGVDEMQRAEVPSAVRTVFVDYEDDQETVRKQINLLAQRARAGGTVIGIGHPRKNTLAVLRVEVPKLMRVGYQFVSASEAVQ